ncbi:MAG: hypothetical protein ACLQVD_06450 [Capsulimonadaceae bacterium]
MALTRQQIKTMASHQLGEFLGTRGADSPFLYDTLVNMATDDVARSTDCYAGSVGTDVVAGQSTYSLPQLYKIRGAFWTDGSGDKIELVETTTPELDDRFSNLATSAGWRNAPPGDPIYFVTRGMNILLLYPTPDTSSFVFGYTDLMIQPNVYQVASAGQRPFAASDTGYTLRIACGNGFNTGIYMVLAVDSNGVATLDSPAGMPGATGGIATLSTGGLLVEGFLAPGESWPAASSVCPLPERAHIAVVWRTAMLRAIQFPTPENQARLPMLDTEFKRQKAMLAAEVSRLTPATSHADFHRFPFGGGYY